MDSANIIAVRIRFLKVILNVDAITQPITGIGQYTLNLGQRLQQMPTIEQLRLFAADRWVSELNPNAPHSRWLGRLRRWVPFKSLALNAYAKRRASKFTQLASGLEDHVLHSPNFVLMPFDGPSVATFHDLSFVHYRDTQPAYRLRFLDREIPKTLAQAQVLITPSAHVKQEIIDHYGFPAERIHVTPLGVAAGFKPRDQQTVHATLVQQGLKYNSYVLSVATTEPRKNLERLLTAYAQLPAPSRQSFPLVLVGSTGWLNQQLNQTIQSLVKAGEIKSLGYVDEKTLQHLYAGARVVALPSLYEGFGLPVIEAMASGTAVLTSAGSAMQEVAAGHACLCDPLAVDDMAAGLQNLLEDDKQAASLASAGLAHSQSFSWQRCAELTAAAYAAANVATRP